MKKNATQQLLDSVLLAKEKANSGELDASIRFALLDYAAVLRAGITDFCSDPANRQIYEVLGSDGVLGKALLYGLCAHRLELDDGFRAGGIHIAAPVLSALFSLNVDLSWSQIAEAVTCGYEAAGVLATAMQPSHKRTGFHSTGTCGCVGAAVAVAVAQGQTPEQMMRTISAAAGMASGLLELQEDGSQLKPVNAGNAASNGVKAAWLGLSGLCFPQDAVGGKRGMLHCLQSAGDALPLLDDPVVARVYHKLYPSCRHGHAAIDAAHDIFTRSNYSVNDIESVDIETYKDAIFGHDATSVQTSAQAMMSIPYCVSCMLVDGGVNLESFDDRKIQNPQIRQVAKSIRMKESQRFNELAPGRRGALVRVTLSSGIVLEKEMLSPKGEPENPVVSQELIDKSVPLFIRGGMSDSEARAAADAILDKENLTFDAICDVVFGNERTRA